MAARRRRENALVVVLAVLAVIGGGRAIFGWLLSDSQPVSTSEITNTMVGHAQMAGAFAEDFVVTYLNSSSGQENDVARFVDTQQLVLPKVAQQASAPTVFDIKQTDSRGSLEIWAVVVSVRVGSGDSNASDTSGGRRLYRVAVSQLGGAMRALSLPAEIQPPARGPDVSLGYGTTCMKGTALYDTASGFLGALLTGSGDVSRYTSSGSDIAAVKPTPYAAATIVSLASDDSSCGLRNNGAHVLATVTPQSEDGAAAQLTYPITMVRSGGSWQVQAIDWAPVLRQPIGAVTGNASSVPTTTANSSEATTTAGDVPPATHN